MRLPALLALLTLVFFSALANAQMYRWTDANGKVHYTDQKPPEAKDVRKIKPLESPAEAKAAQKSFAERELDQRKKQKEAGEADAKKAKETTEKAEREEQCAQARSNLQGVESGAIRFTPGKNGEQVALEGSVRETELTRLRKSVADWCK
jgi:hypothetical protein